MKIATATICHPPNLKYLEEHLKSINLARNGRDISMYIINSSMGRDDMTLAEQLVKRLNIEDIHLEQTEESYSIGRARNALFDKVKSDWVVFLDADTIVDGQYIDNLVTFMEKHDLSETYGLTGLVIPNKVTSLGRYECIMDIIALVGKTKGIQQKVYEEMFEGIDFPKSNSNSDAEMEFWRDLSNHLKYYEGNEITYLQGTNQVVHKKVRDILGGFDDLTF